jgi:lysophospholipase L1-like esterase
MTTSLAQRFADSKPQGISNVSRDATGALVGWVENGCYLSVFRGTGHLALTLQIGNARAVETFYFDAAGRVSKVEGVTIPTALRQEIFESGLNGVASLRPAINPLTGEMAGFTKPNGQVVTLRTSPGGVSLLGDSRTAVNRVLNAGVNLAVYNASGVFSQLRAKSGQRFRLLYNGGVSGERTDQINARVDTALSYYPGLVIYWAGINDIAQSYPSGTTSASTAFANIQAAGNKCIATGAQFLVFADYPATGWTAAQVGQMFELNARLSNWAQTTPGVILFDACRYMLDYTTATAPTQKAGYTYDGVHPSMRGAYVLAKALDGLISSSVPNFSPKRISGLQDNFTNNPWELLANGNHITTSGGAGSGAGGITGTVPGSMNITRTGTTAATVVSTAVAADGISGNDCVLTITGAASGDVIRARHLPTLGNFVLGATYQAMCDIDVSGTSGLDSVRLAFEYEDSSVAYLTIDQNYATGERPGIPDAESFTYTLLTDPITIPLTATLTNARWYIEVRFNTAAGAATVKMRNCSMRRIPT